MSTEKSASPPAVAALTCAVLEIEFRHLARELPNVCHIEVLEQGLHNEPDRLRRTLQEAVSRLERETAAEAIALGYGLCSRGIEGVRTERCRLVVPRAHDCITLLLGDKDRYARYVAEHPGTYWYSPGWIRHTPMPGRERYDSAYRDYCEKYGQDNADYLMEIQQQWVRNYDRATYVDIGIGATDEDIRFTQQCADWLSWTFDRQYGDPALLRDLLAGPWDAARFVVLLPGQTARLTADERVIEAVDGVHAGAASGRENKTTPHG